MALLKVGDQAPDFTLQTHEGKSLSLSSLRGKRVLLWFYPKADTPGCTIEGKGFCSQYQDFADRDIAVLGVSFDKVHDNASFAKKFGFQYPLLCDTERTLGLAYGACDNAKAGYANRISYLIDEQGKIAKVYPQVNPREHPGQVLADLTPD
jgi:peroxiredoxin Q/BCP